MAVLVKHKETEKIYVLIGTGYGAYKATRASILGGNLFPHEDEGKIPVAAVSDEKGNILWILTEELQVIEIDGLMVEDILKPYKKQCNDLEEKIYDYCPACGGKVSTKSGECPECGISFLEVEE